MKKFGSTRTELEGTLPGPLLGSRIHTFIEGTAYIIQEYGARSEVFRFKAEEFFAGACSHLVLNLEICQDLAMKLVRFSCIAS